MSWELDFISEENLTNHIKEYIQKYGDKLKPYNLRKFNSNIVDPVKMLFDKNVYRMNWEEIIKNEIFRQRDKAGSNDIGYFHQNIFKYIQGCTVPKEGWDVIYENENGIQMPDGAYVKKIYAEIKNKHNTMNSASGARTYIKMQNQVLHDDDCACYLVETIAKRSQNVKWTTSIDKKRVEHKLIRRVSMDEFYGIITGDETSFYKMCMVIPGIIEKVLHTNQEFSLPNDTVFEELTDGYGDDDNSIVLAMYMLGFESYSGFKEEVEK